MFTLNQTFSARSLAILTGAIIMAQTTQSQGQVTFTSALRNVGVAAPFNGVPDTQIESTAFGDFDETLMRMPNSGGQIGRLLASQQSRLLSDRIEVTLLADTSQTNPNYSIAANSLSASSQFFSVFSVSSTTDFLAVFGTIGISSQLVGEAGVSLFRRLPTGNETLFEVRSSSDPISGTLMPGDYALGALVSAQSRRLPSSIAVGRADAAITLYIPPPATISLLALAASAPMISRSRRI